jgi:protein-arginine deiminase
MRIHRVFFAKTWRPALAAGAAGLVGAASCTGNSSEAFLDEDDNRNESIDGIGTSGQGAAGNGATAGAGGDPAQGSVTAGPASGTGGTPTPCAPGTTADCYSGPSGTEGVGVCVAGTQTCLADGSGYGPCEGEVTPTAESCDTEGDEDCDGKANEECACTPGQIVDCYSGPPSTKNVGSCKSGTQQCDAQGTGFGPCQGEVLPKTDDCLTPADEDCDGANAVCADAVVDLRADVNRNGTIDMADPTEDASEATWSASAGAIFLANIDDDDLSCSTTGTDSQLASCNDATNNTIDGSDDLLDLARLKTAPWSSAPAGASGWLTLSSPGASYVRLFKKSGTSFAEYLPGTKVSLTELKSGVEFAIEGKDFVRDDAVWDGFVDVTWNVDGASVTGGTDKVRMRVAPVLFHHHNQKATTYYVTSLNSQGSIDFRADLADAATAAGVPEKKLFVSDQWTEDFFETAYMTMPKVGGQHVIHVNFRSPNYTGSLRAAGKVVFTVLRGKDVAGAVEYDPGHPDGMDTLNSFGNLETIPPYTLGGQSWPMGRVLRGSHPQFYPDEDFDAMVNGQKVQSSVYIDTAWLLVAHVDETLSFIKANTPRGWVMPIADPALAKSMLQTEKNNGNGSKQMFVGKYWSDGSPAAVSITSVLADTDVMNESAWAATQIAAQLGQLKTATGITDAELVKVPFLLMQASGYSVAFQPGTVNLLVLDAAHIASPDPHGPVIGGVDIFEKQMVDAFAPFGVTVHFIEDWDLYHRLDGEVHCGTNATRAIPSAKWWESGK